MANRVAGKIKLQSVDELLGVPEIAGTQEIDVRRIHSFPNHPFKVVDDDRMNTLVDSIRENGILNPVIVRPDKNGDYEMISGHRRLHAAGIVGLDKIPAIVKEMSDDEAIIKMVDANIQREEILPSERAFSFKMKMEAMKRRGYRTDLEYENDNKELTSGTEFPKSDKWSRDVVGYEAGMTGRQVTKYIRLTELTPQFLDCVDLKKITIAMGVDISYLDKQIQQWVYEYYRDNGFLKPIQVEALKNSPALSNANQFKVISILNEALPQKSTGAKISFSEKKLDRYFPPNFSAKEREDVIIRLLEQWSIEQRQA